MIYDKYFVIFLLIVVLILISIMFILNNYKKEGFSVYSEGDRFTKSQHTKFWNNQNMALSTNSGLEEDIKKASAAFSITDTLNNTRNANTDISFYFEKDILPGNAELNLQCSSVLEPKFLPGHDENAPSGCGWWYNDNDNTISIGARGTKSGPFDTDTLTKKVYDLSALPKKDYDLIFIDIAGKEVKHPIIIK